NSASSVLLSEARESAIPRTSTCHRCLLSFFEVIASSAWHPEQAASTSFFPLPSGRRAASSAKATTAASAPSRDKPNFDTDPKAFNVYEPTAEVKEELRSHHSLNEIARFTAFRYTQELFAGFSEPNLETTGRMHETLVCRCAVPCFFSRLSL